MRTIARVVVRASAACVVVLLAGAGAGEPIRIGPPVVIPRPADDTRDQVMPAIAFDGKGTFLVAWQQGRDYYETETSDICCARVSGDGKLLDERPVVVCAARDSQMRPRVAFTSGVFLVVWQDLRSGKGFDIYGSRVRASGELLDPEGFLIAGGPSNQAQPAVAPGEGQSLVAWQEFRPGEGNVIRATRLGADGSARDKPGVPLATGGRAARGGSVALVRAGGGWFAFWRMAAAGLKGGVARLAERDGVLVTTEIAGPMPLYSIQSRGRLPRVDPQCPHCGLTRRLGIGRREQAAGKAGLQVDLEARPPSTLSQACPIRSADVDDGRRNRPAVAGSRSSPWYLADRSSRSPRR